MELLRIDNPVKEAHDALAHAATDTIRDTVLKGGSIVGLSVNSGPARRRFTGKQCTMCVPCLAGRGKGAAFGHSGVNT